jgi:hypothetical protein
MPTRQARTKRRYCIAKVVSLCWAMGWVGRGMSVGECVLGLLDFVSRNRTRPTSLYQSPTSIHKRPYHTPPLHMPRVKSDPVARCTSTSVSVAQLNHHGHVVHLLDPLQAHRGNSRRRSTCESRRRRNQLYRNIDWETRGLAFMGVGWPRVFWKVGPRGWVGWLV